MCVLREVSKARAVSSVVESSVAESTSDMTPSVKCSLRGGITMLSSSPDIGGSLASREEVNADTRVRRSGR